MPASGRINRLDGFFDGLFGDGFDSATPVRTWPPAAMWEDDDFIHIEVDLPGVVDEDVSMTVHEGMLFIRFERAAAEGRRYAYDGRRYGRFERAFPLADVADADGAVASLINGVLFVDLPKSPAVKPKKIRLKMD
jgi:HSP20 family protein